MTYLIYTIICLILIAIDQYTKTLVKTYLVLGQSIPLIKNFFSLTYVLNDGAGFSLLRGQQTLFLLITPLAIIIFTYLLIKEKHRRPLNTAAYLMIIAGTIGNFLDRLSTGLVVDFLDFNLFGYDFPIFNFADILLTVGIFGLMLTILTEKNDNGTDKTNN